MNDLRALGALAWLDVRRWLQSPSALVTALVPPLAMALLLAVLALTVTEQPVALVVEAHGPYALRMEEILRADEEAYLLRVTDTATANRLLRDQEVAAILTIPADFDRKATDHAAILHLKLNNVDIDFADDIRRSVERSIGQFDAPVLALGDKADKAEETANEAKNPSNSENKRESSALPGNAKSANQTEEEEEAAEANQPFVPYKYAPEPGTNPYHIQVEEHNLRVTDVDFLHYQLVPVLVLLVLNIGMMGTAQRCASDAEAGTGRLLTLAPVASWALVAGRLLGGLITTACVLVPIIAVCVTTCAIVVPANHWAALAALFLTTALCAAGLGAALGTALRGSRNVAMAGSILATFLFLMGGGFTTIAFLPRWLHIISAFDPMRYAIDGLRETLFYPNLTGFATDLAVLTGTAIVSVLAGSVLVIRAWRH